VVCVGVLDQNRALTRSFRRLEDKETFVRTVALYKARVFTPDNRDQKLLLHVVAPDIVDIFFKLVLREQIKFHAVVRAENPEGDVGKRRIACGKDEFAPGLAKFLDRLEYGASGITFETGCQALRRFQIGFVAVIIELQRQPEEVELREVGAERSGGGIVSRP